MRNQRWIVPLRDGKHHPDLRLDVTDEAIVYDRFSTPDQGKEGRDSKRRQKSRNELAAEHHGLRVNWNLRASDFGISSFRGKNYEKGALGALKEAFDKGDIPRFTKVITESIDRITRASEFDATNTFHTGPHCC